jgi:hypothetical protein
MALRPGPQEAASMDSPPPPQIAGQPDQDEAAPVQVIVVACHSQLRRDLDWVVLRAIEKDRERRYGSVAELEQDLERYLRGEAVLAAPPSTWYALRKSARRHRSVVVAATLVLAALLLGLAGTLSQAREARKEAAAARAAEASQTRLGHKSLDVTQVYAERNLKLSRDVAHRIG